MEINTSKKKIRGYMKELRNGLDVLSINSLSEKAFQNLLKIDLGEIDKIFIYNSFGSELDTSKIIEYFLRENKNVYIPRVEGDVMKSVKVENSSCFKRSLFGIFEPEGDAEEIDNFIAIMPCLAVDMQGNRIGYGGGYYDKFLANKSAKKIVLCYDFQILDEINSCGHDVRADFIVTDKRVIDLIKEIEKEK